jgi:uncharacterized protein
MWSMQKDTTLLEFPCSYPLKVLGSNKNEFYSMVCAIIERHVADTSQITYSSRTSNGDKYMAITATFMAQNHEQLTAMYEELNGHPLVIMTL